VNRRLPAAVRRLPARVRVAAAIEKLDPRTQHVLALRLAEGLSALEASGALQIPASRIERILLEALDRIAAEAMPARPRRTLRRAA